MRKKHRVTLRCVVLLSAATMLACADAPTVPSESIAPAAEAAVHFWDALATTRWNLRATQLFRTTSPLPPNGQAWASRTLTYLSIAQYRAALAATAPSNRSKRPSVSAAVARASVDMLTRFYTQTPGYSPPSTIPAALEQMLVADRSESAWPGEANTDVTLGDALGMQIAQAVWNQAQADNYNAASTLTNFAALQTTRPIGPAYWVPSGAPVRSLWGVRPFFLETDDLLLSPPPPNLAGLQAGAAFVVTTMTVGSPAKLASQVSIANLWNKVPPNGPFTAGEWNQKADSLIQLYHRTEVEAARILAYANAAAFDSQIECFTTKYTYWVARPAQVIATIVPVFATPNHPSYPSGHSCISAAFGAYLSSVFPDSDTKNWLASQVDEAGWSRIYAGIHYTFDIDAGYGVGSRAAAKALVGKLEGE
ncbi:MAG TPA: phosphatase PAP2 family protein [Gemmatimonadaceae bacterium]